jgi:monoamine oxidase
VNNIVILEARNRVGGRLYSIPFNNSTFLDLGASWIHGASPKNPLVKLVDSSGVKISDQPTDFDNANTYYSNGKMVSTSKENAYARIWERWEEYLLAEQEEYDEDPGLSIVVSNFIRENGLEGEDLIAFKYHLNVYIQHEYAAPISKLSLWFDEEEEFRGGDFLVLGGYQNVAKYMSQGLDVRLNHQVTEINYFNRRNVNIKARKRDGSMESFTAKYVICTLPLGVLQANSVKFNPVLPSVNRRAISALGSGLLNKCIMVFSKAFWGTEEEFIERIDQSGIGAWEETLSIMPSANVPVLYASNAADYAASLEKKSDEQTCLEFLAALRTIWPGAPSPVQCHVSRWLSDPFSKGSYSYTTPKMEFRQAHTDVAKPVGGLLYFAGEHTSLKHPATVHGALITGDNNACAILSKMNNDNQCNE